jgi:hypothetical protein
MGPEGTLDHLVVRAIRQYREKMVLRDEGKAGPERESAPRPGKSYSLSGMAQTCLGCEISVSGDCDGTGPGVGTKGIPPLPCRDRQVLLFMAKRSIASL